MPSSGLFGFQAHLWCTDINARKNTSTHKIKMIQKQSPLQGYGTKPILICSGLDGRASLEMQLFTVIPFYNLEQLT